MGIGYDFDEECDFEKDEKPNTLQSRFFTYGKQNGVIPKGIIALKPKAKVKPHSCLNHAFMYIYILQKNQAC